MLKKAVTNQTETNQTETNQITWQTHHLREQTHLVPFVLLGYGAALALWWLCFPVPMALFLPVIALTSALSEFLFPVKYALTSDGVSVAYGPLHRLFLSWEEIKRATQGSEGVFLSSLPKPSRLDNFRGLRLRFSPSQSEAERDVIKAMLRSHLLYRQEVRQVEEILCH